MKRQSEDLLKLERRACALWVSAALCAEKRPWQLYAAVFCFSKTCAPPFRVPFSFHAPLTITPEAEARAGVFGLGDGSGPSPKFPASSSTPFLTEIQAPAERRAAFEPLSAAHCFHNIPVKFGIPPIPSFMLQVHPTQPITYLQPKRTVSYRRSSFWAFCCCCFFYQKLTVSQKALLPSLPEHDILINNC